MKWNTWAVSFLALLLYCHPLDTKAEEPSRGFWVQGGYGVTRIETLPFYPSQWKKHESFEYFALGAGFDSDGPIGIGIERTWLRDTNGFFSSVRWKTLRAQLRIDPWRHLPVSLAPIVGIGWGNAGREYQYVDVEPASGRPASYTASGLLGELGIDLRLQPGSWVAVHAEALHRWSNLHDIETIDPADRPLEDSLEGWAFRVGIRLYLEPYTRLPQAKKD